MTIRLTRAAAHALGLDEPPGGHERAPAGRSRRKQGTATKLRTPSPDERLARAGYWHEWRAGEGDRYWTPRAGRMVSVTAWFSEMNEARSAALALVGEGEET